MCKVCVCVCFHGLKYEGVLNVTHNCVLLFFFLRLIPTCNLEIVPVVDFGILVANSKVHCKEISITNRGKAPGTYSVLYKLTDLEKLLLL